MTIELVKILEAAKESGAQIVAMSALLTTTMPMMEKVVEALKAAGIRVTVDTRNEKISYKIRELSLQKLPYIVVVGEKEKEAGCVAVRARGGRDLGVMKVEDFINMLIEENDSRCNG